MGKPIELRPLEDYRLWIIAGSLPPKALGLIAEWATIRPTLYAPRF